MDQIKKKERRLFKRLAQREGRTYEDVLKEKGFIDKPVVVKKAVNKKKGRY